MPRHTATLIAIFTCSLAQSAVTLPPVSRDANAWQAGLHYTVLVPPHTPKLPQGKVEAT